MQNFARSLVFFYATHGGLSERGITCSLSCDTLIVSIELLFNHANSMAKKTVIPQLKISSLVSIRQTTTGL